MRSWKRVLPFLILNVIISAATTLVVLVLWDRTQHPSLLPSSIDLPTIAQSVGQPANGSPSEASTVQPTLPPVDQTVIRIDTVIGAGDVANEVIVFTRVGDSDLNLNGWKVRNGRGDEFTFPDLSLSKNGSIRLYTRSGTNTVIELFWGRDNAAWRSGDTAQLTDPQGNVRATYTIP